MPEIGKHEEFAAQLGLLPSEASMLQCTAEHLTARADGGKNEADNIAAAHLTCNQRRHSMWRNHPPSPEKMFEIAHSSVWSGGWFKKGVLTALVGL